MLTRWLQLWEQFETKYSNKLHFAFNFLSGLTHIAANNLQLYDIPLSEALFRMKHTGVFDNTVMINTGDHGNRMASFFE